MAFLQPKVMLMLFFGFSSGLPLLLIFSSLSLWLREAGIELASVTYFSWAALGYSFKFIWAPLIDRVPVPFLSRAMGQRRAWLLLAQIGVILALCVMALTDPSRQGGYLTIMAVGAVVLGFSGATQDIVIDAYRIESAGAELQALMSSTYVAGYRVAMIVSGAGALYIAEELGSTAELYDYSAWMLTYMVMACFMLVGVLATFIAHEPEIDRGEESQRFQNNDYIRLVLTFFAAVVLFVVTFSGALLSLFGVAGVLALVTTVGILYTRQRDQLDDRWFVGSAMVRVLVTSLGVVFILILMFSVLSFFQDYEPDSETLLGALSAFLVVCVKFIFSLAVGVSVFYVSVKIKFANTGLVKLGYIDPVKSFVLTHGLKVACLILAFICFYRISDIVLGVISNNFYHDLGFSKKQIAGVVKTFGLLMTILGGFVGGVFVLRYGVLRVLMLGAVLTIITNLFFIALSYAGDNLYLLYAVISADNLTAGLASAAFIAFLSSLTDVRFTAMQYAIFSSLMTLIPKLIGGYSGSIAQDLGYPVFFGFASLLGVPVLFLLFKVEKYLKLEEKEAA